MKQNSELKYLIDANLVNRISIQGNAEQNMWEIHVDIVDSVVDQYAAKIVEGVNSWVLETDQGQIKTYSSLDQAYSDIRSLGWLSIVEISG